MSDKIRCPADKCGTYLMRDAKGLYCPKCGWLMPSKATSAPEHGQKRTTGEPAKDYPQRASQGPQF
jgi:uncharacterized Zn finger protein (UPF0148 family)